MIRVAARRSDGTKLKLNAPVNSLEEAWDLLHTELKAKKIPSALVAIPAQHVEGDQRRAPSIGIAPTEKARKAATGALTREPEGRMPRAELDRGICYRGTLNDGEAA